MAISRSPLAFMRRKGLSHEFKPGPRFTPARFLVHRYGDARQSDTKSCVAEGDPPPDRAAFKPWPLLPEQE